MDSKHQRIRLVWPCAIALALGIQSHFPAPPAQVPGFRIDWIAHFLLYGLLATAILRCSPARIPTATQQLIAVIITAVYGASDEIHQMMGTVRTADFSDFAFDVAGAAVAAVSYRWLTIYRTALEWPVFRRSPEPRSENA